MFHHPRIMMIDTMKNNITKIINYNCLNLQSIGDNLLLKADKDQGKRIRRIRRIRKIRKIKKRRRIKNIKNKKIDLNHVIPDLLLDKNINAKIRIHRDTKKDKIIAWKNSKLKFKNLHSKK